MRRKTKAVRDDFPKPGEVGPISRERWQRHRTRMLEWAAPGSRPEEWWLYDVGRQRPEHQGRVLYEMGELKGTELVQCLQWWRQIFSDAIDAADFMPVAQYWRWPDIPVELRRRWMAERKRQRKTISKMAKAT